MKTLGRMHIRNGIEAINALSRLADARVEVRKVIMTFTSEFHGPQGVSSDCALENHILAAIDAHVAHLVDRHKNALWEAIWGAGEGP